MRNTWIADSRLLLLMPLECTGYWGGVQSGDYQSACSLSYGRYLIPFLISGKTAFILGDEPAPAMVDYASEETIVIRWVYAEDEDDLIGFAKCGDCVFENDPDICFSNDNAEWVIMDAARPGSDAQDSWLPFRMPAGNVVAKSSQLRSPINSAIVHRFAVSPA